MDNDGNKSNGTLCTTRQKKKGKQCLFQATTNKTKTLIDNNVKHPKLRKLFSSHRCQHPPHAMTSRRRVADDHPSLLPTTPSAFTTSIPPKKHEWLQ
jgi:hypothetical protein